MHYKSLLVAVGTSTSQLLCAPQVQTNVVMVREARVEKQRKAGRQTKKCPKHGIPSMKYSQQLH